MPFAPSRIVAELDSNRGPHLATIDACVTIGIACRPVEVAPHRYQEFVSFARWYYRGKHFPRYQLLWPSTDGHYPWDIEATEAFNAWHSRRWEALHG